MWSTLIIILLIGLAAGNEFSYENQTDWNKEHSKCKGNYQSPIELDRKKAIIVGNLPAINFINYKTPIDKGKIDILNNGYTIRISFDRVSFAKRPKIKDGPLKMDKYVIEDIHFHWGALSTGGTEHKLNGVSHTLEAHLVHRNVKFNSFGAAKGKDDGIVVLAVPFQEKSRCKSTWGVITDLVPEVTYNGNKTTFHRGFKMDTIFPLENVRPYFVYRGSLTTPLCEENVLWIVYSEARCMLKEEVCF